MKILIASDFYAEFELYETEKPNGLKNWVALSMISPDPIRLDPKVHKLIGSQDDMTAEEATAQADEIIYTSEIAEALEA
jgi:hypothetical protein